MLVLPLFITVLIWYLIVCIKWKKVIFDTVERIPGLRWYPVIGTFYPFLGVARADRFYKFGEITGKFAPFFKSWNGNIPEVHVLKAEHLQIVMKSSINVTKGPMYDHLLPWFGEGLFIANGEKWFRQRKVLTPTFHFKILESFIGLFAEKATATVKALEEKANGEYFSIIPDVYLCALSVICDAAMGVPLEELTPNPKEYSDNAHTFCELSMWRYLHPHINDFIFNLLPEGKRYKSALKALNAFSDRAVELKKTRFRYSNYDKYLAGKAEDGHAGRTSFLDLVLDATEDEKALKSKDIAGLVNTFIFAGHETTASTLCWAIFLLGNNPDIQDKVHEEVLKVLKNKDHPTTMEELSELKYLECVIKEALRLYPVLPIISRRLTEDVEIAGYKVPAGTQTLLHVFDVHRDPEHYPEPTKFDPDRFLPENTKNRHPFAFVPFSAGPRNCIGQRFSFLEMKAILSAIIKKIKFTSMNKPEDIRLFAHIVLQPQTELNVKVEKRELPTN